MNAFFKIRLLIVIVLSVSHVAAADRISGAVRNQTTGRPASGDDVLLLRLGERMEEEDRTKTDVLGKFVLNVTSPAAGHIVRVNHEGINYEQVVQGKGPFTLWVFDVVERIPGLAGNLGIAQIESDGSTFKVKEMYAITNASNPPVTQYGPRNFEVVLPAKAAFESTQVKGPGVAMWINMTPVPVRALQGHYTINYPLRPGETLFKLAYHLPNQGAATFHLKLAYPITNFGVVHPSSMTFKALRTGTFQSQGVVNGMLLETAISTPQLREVPAFEIAGRGIAKPAPVQTTKARTQTFSAAPKPDLTHTLAGVAPVPQQSKKEFWVVIVATAIILVTGGVMLAKRMRRQIFRPIGPIVAGGGDPLLESMKDELSALEAEKLQGSISAEEYASSKQALSIAIQRIMVRETH